MISIFAFMSFGTLVEAYALSAFSNHPFGDLILYDFDGSKILQFSYEDLQFVTEYDSFMTFKQKINYTNQFNLGKQSTNSINIYSKLSGELERKLSGLEILLLTEVDAQSVSLDEAFIQVMININEPTNVSPLSSYVIVEYEIPKFGNKW